MNSELIGTKFENKIKECLQEMYQAIDSSFSRINTFLDQLSLNPYPPVPQITVNKAPIFPQISLSSLETLADQVIEPIFNFIIHKEFKQKEQQLVQFEQQNKKEMTKELKSQDILQNNNHQYNLKPFTFKLIQNHSIQQNETCRAIAINKDNSIVLATCENDIKVFEFKQEQLTQTQILSEHQDSVSTLNFMKKSTQFVSGSWDKQIIIWFLNNNNNQWTSSYKLNGHSDLIYSLVLNNNEDLIISGGYDKTIKFWVKQSQQWLCSQTITDHRDYVYGIGLNEQQNKVISCGNDNLILIIEQSSQDQKWNVIQKISVEQYGYRLCFINDNVFTFQPFLKEQMHVYEMNSTNKQYVKTKDIAVKRGDRCQIYFGQQYIKSKCLLVNKNGYNVNLIRKNQNGDFITLQSIDFGHKWIMGQMSEDGEYLMTWDEKSKEIQIRKCHYQ